VTYERSKAELLEVLDEMRRRVEEGDIKEFVAASVTKDGDVQIHASVLDLPGGVGLFEIGKNQLINYGT
jgi:hypothetical protein